MNTSIEQLKQVIAAMAVALDSLHGDVQKALDAIDALWRSQYEIHVQAGADLQAAMDRAPEGATLFLPAGATFSGHFVCKRAQRLTTEGVTLPEGARVAVVEGRPTVPLAILTTPDAGSPWTAAPGSVGCALGSVEIAAGADPRGVLVAIGTGTEPSLDLLPRDVTIRGAYIHGHPTTGVKRCVGLHGITVTIADSSIAGCRIQGQDSQAIAGWNGPGPYVIENNYLEAGSEAVLFGGDDPRIAGLVPSDIVIRGNTFSRPLAWKVLKGWVVKNLLELKNARRVTVTDNVFENNWPDGQVGYAVLFTPRNQYGRADWSTVEDVLMARNLLRTVSSGINITGDDDLKPSQRTSRIVIRDTTILTSKATLGGDGYCLQIGRAPQQLTIDRLTCLNDGSHAIYSYAGGKTPSGETLTTAGFSLTNSLWLHRTYGFDGVGSTGLPIPTLAAYYPGAVWGGNVVGGGRQKDYPPDTVVLPLSDFMAAFEDYATGKVKSDGVLAGKGAQR